MNKWISNIIVTFCIQTLTCGICYSQQTEKVYLSGTGSDHTVNWEFFCTGGMNANRWTTIPVPSCWELQGFGKYDYGFAKDSVRGKEQGFYKYNFNAPLSWKNKNINIVFEGVMTDAEVKINGRSAGEVHQGAFYAFKYDITKLLKYGESNLLEVTVSKHSSNESVNNAERKADFWIFGGIFRPVWLEVLPKNHIDDVEINGFASGFIRGSFVTNILAIDCDFADVQIKDIKGKLVDTIHASEGGLNYSLFSFQKRIKNILAWNPESPTLYYATLTVYNKGKILHTVTQRFGFRTIELKQRDGIYVNGVKIKFKGVNRHSFRPETGRATSKQNSIEDVLLMKDMNMNAVRMSHYPPDGHFLDVCDSLGLFVMDELAGWHGHYDTPTGTKLVREMIAHNINHPSIIFWANGNEGGHNFELDSLLGFYENSPIVVHPWQLFNGIETQHYREYNYGIGNYEQGREIVMPTEFLHGQFDGGHGAGLEDYWEKMWHDPLSAGGFLWDFADNAVVRKDLKDSLDTDKHRAADGILGPHHEKEGSYYAIKEIWSPVYFERKEITAAFDGKLNIENRYHFTNLNQLSFSYKLKIITTPNLPEKTGSIAAPDIKPRGKGVLKIKLPADWKDFYALYITVKDKSGKEILTKSFPIIRPVYLKNILEADEGLSSPLLSQTDSLFTVKTNTNEVSFHKRNGLLTEVRTTKGIIPLTNGPIIQEGINNFGSFTARQDGKNIIISSVFEKTNV